MLTRRTATVTMSAPEAAWHSRITGCDGYLPVPTMSRDRNVRPAMTKGVSVTVPVSAARAPRAMVLAAADRVDDFEPVALADHDGR